MKFFSTSLTLLKLLCSRNPGILFLVKYPEENDLTDGYFQRVLAIDQALNNFTRIYTHKTNTHYKLDIRGSNLDNLNIRLSNTLFGKILTAFILSAITLRFGHVYSHSIYCLIHPFHRVIFKLGRKRVLDFHGVVPEEILMMTQKKNQADQFNTYEKFAVRKANIIISVTQNMLKHIQHKYGLHESDKAFLIIPAYNPQGNPTVQSTNEKIPNRIIYCGGLQAWQQIEKMLYFVHEHPEWEFVFLTPDPDKIKDLYYGIFKTPFPGISYSADSKEVLRCYSTASYGLIFREDHIINYVASPTKLTEYIENCIIPIVDCPKIGDFLIYNYQFIPHKVSTFPNKKQWGNMIHQNKEIALKIDILFQNGAKSLRNLIYKYDSEKSKNKYISVIEPFCIKEEHAPFNAAMLCAIQKAHPECTICFFSELAHWNCVKNLLKNQSIYINHTPIHLTSRRWGTGILRWRHENKNIKRILSFCENSKCNIIYCLTISLSTILSIKKNIITNRENKKIKFFLTMHSILHQLDSTKKGIYNLLTPPCSFSAAFLNLQFDNIRYIVLGESIKQNLLNNCPEMRNFVFSIDHPFLANQWERLPLTKDKIIHIASIGVAEKSKGIEDIISIANTFFQEKKVFFEHIGCIHGDYDLKKTNLNCTLNTKDLLPRDLFESKLQKATHVLFCYPNTKYKLYASGAFFDAITFSKPIIALKNDFFNYYFSKYGDLGYLCDNTEEIRFIIKNLIENFDDAKYKRQQAAIIALAEKIHPSEIAKQLKEMECTT